eukprot:TRINITY_DN66619_c0_g4_i1.p2 TRINITY_DN66619_c0_g4~~TRINITY_DN66619_c0_g4_i1.p2  ORF type:complete len:107 (-),score=9.41 TRINITY_DN66619_c0_g4_i1:96-416(-)
MSVLWSRDCQFTAQQNASQRHVLQLPATVRIQQFVLVYLELVLLMDDAVDMLLLQKPPTPQRTSRIKQYDWYWSNSSFEAYLQMYSATRYAWGATSTSPRGQGKGI